MSPVTHATSGAARKPRTIPLSHHGSTRTSSSVKATMSAVASASPRFRAHDRPGLGSRTYLIRGPPPNSRCTASFVAPELGALSTTTTSNGRYRRAARPRSATMTLSGRSLVQTTTVTRGRQPALREFLLGRETAGGERVKRGQPGGTAAR